MNRNRLAVLLIVIAIGCGRPRVDRVAEISVGKSVLLASDETSGLRTGSEDWPNWRGPNTDGIATGAPIPTKWSATENVTWKLALPVLPWLSVAVQVTVVVPSAKVEPADGAQEAATMPSTLSSAFAEKVAAAPPGPVASSVMSEGTDTTGAVVS